MRNDKLHLVNDWMIDPLAKRRFKVSKDDYEFSADLDGVTIIRDTIKNGQPLTIMLVPDDDCHILLETVTIMMNGADITEDVYDAETNIVTIDSVNGAISITAQAVIYDAEVLYMRSDGTAYINTGVKASSNIRIDAHITIAQDFTGNSCAIFGSKAENNSSAVALQYYNTTGTTTWRWNYGSDIQTYDHGGETGDFMLDSTNESRKLKITGSSEHTITCADSSFSNGNDIYIFGMNDDGTLSGRNALTYAFVKTFKIYNGQTLIRDYISVRKNGVGYLYDKVTKTLFGNANNSGAFIYGVDV